jgi:hypothetical protein
MGQLYINTMKLLNYTIIYSKYNKQKWIFLQVYNEIIADLLII